MGATNIGAMEAVLSIREQELHIHVSQELRLHLSVYQLALQNPNKPQNAVCREAHHVIRQSAALIFSVLAGN